MLGSFSRRVVVFLLTNAGVLLLFGTVARLLGVEQMLWQAGVGLSFDQLLLFAAAFGFGGSLFSLAISKPMALWMTGARVLASPTNGVERWLVATVSRQAQAAGIQMPSVAIYDAADPNAFATGARRNAALVAVSTGLLEQMQRHEVEAVLAHEVSHVANGDMVTMALLQGVLNTFVIFISRLVGFFVDRVLLRNERGLGAGYWISTMVAELTLGLIATIIAMWYSRRREFRADAGAAQLEGADAMIAALRTLDRQHQPAQLPPTLAAFGIRAGGFGGLFRSHPSIEDRIAALGGARPGR